MPLPGYPIGHYCCSRFACHCAITSKRIRRTGRRLAINDNLLRSRYAAIGPAERPYTYFVATEKFNNEVVVLLRPKAQLHARAAHARCQHARYGPALCLGVEV